MNANGPGPLPGLDREEEEAGGPRAHRRESCTGCILCFAMRSRR